MTHEREVRTLLTRVRRRWFGAALLGAIARGAARAAVVVLAGLVANAWLSPRDLPLVALAAVTALGAIGVAALAVWPLRRRPSDRQVARFIEEQRPDLEDRLASATELVTRPSEMPMRDLMLADAAARTRELPVDDVVSRDALRGAAWRSAAALVVLGATLTLALAPATRAVAAARVRLLPAGVALVVEPGDVRLVSGQPLIVRARLTGLPDTYDTAPPVLTVSGDLAGTRRQEMPSFAGGYAVSFDRVDRSFRYGVTAGRMRSPEFTVTVLHPARVARIDVEYEYPAFTGLARRVEEDGGDIYAPAGTRVRLRIEADKAVRTGRLVMADGSVVELESGAGRSLTGGFEVDDDGSYRVALADIDGLDSPGETEYFVRVMDDRPPDVRIVRPAGDRRVTPLEEVTIEARADDDHGIDRFELVYSVRGGDERVVAFEAGGSVVSRSGSHLLYLEDLDVRPGDFVSYYARARDVSRGRRAREARSDIFFLEVKPFEEEFEAAQSQAGGSGAGQSVANLARAQKDIISATWKLDRRAQGGRSEADIKAVARAQAELRTQAEAAAGGQLRASARGRRGSAGTGSAGAPLFQAVDAMGRAVEQLEALATQGALPHEMAALNQLLRAEAEIRRRQVSRQANAGGGGQGRADRDLSQLFDRELQRQQETNYETPANTRNAEERQKEDALEQIRELARRQNELSRQQRDLARANLDAAELKRQLERLTREQNELRQQAEQLARRLEQQAQESEQSGRPSSQEGREGQSTQGGSQAQGGQPSQVERLRGASDEMRGAASDLRREDLEAAGSRAERAAEALRELERQLRQERPDERQMALGDLQLEARQMAEAQQRVADESSRLDEAGAGEGPPAGETADARRRLAGEQSRLADRAEGFEQSARALGESTGVRDRAGTVGEALREIERARLSGRMRASADAQRRAGAGTEGAGAVAQDEQAVAEALEQIAERLAEATGEAGDAGARALAEQLARARAVRERLDSLERDIQQLEREQAGGEQAGEGRARGGRGTGAGRPAELERLRQEFARELERAQALVSGQAGGAADQGRGSTPEQHEYTAGAPGTQAFKQDYEQWAELRRQLTEALEHVEQAWSEELVARLAQDRLNAGGSLEVPEAYRKLIARYYEALAKKKR